MDALSDILNVVGLTGGVFFDAEFSEPWTVAGQVSAESCSPYMAPPQRVVGFHYVVEGEFTLGLEGRATCELATGEAVMLPRNDLHIMGSTLRLPAVPVSALIEPSARPGLARIKYGGGGARTRMVCGFMGGNAQLDILLASLPAVVKVDVRTLPGASWIHQTFAYAARTFEEDEPGAATVLAKVSELLFVESIRRYLAGLPPGATGWLAGLRDPSVGRALSLLHARPEAGWTAEALARAVNMSRSSFSDRFTQVVGQPPIRYLIGWRMQMARRQLLETDRPVSQIAFEVGYESEAAFTRAFRREHGAPPAAWRRRGAAPESSGPH